MPAVPVSRKGVVRTAQASLPHVVIVHACAGLCPVAETLRGLETLPTTDQIKPNPRLWEADPYALY